ncbi:phage baseplate assembly protein V [Sorangium sp. So ce1097]|uniref:phage baseplate assembly protein V n=1 Tax=Sorangium sp. So ce1097 TaxID=3133330 RepID=UPI003F5EB311
MEQDLVALMLDWMRSKYFGKYRGKVVDNGDATHRGRLLVTVPAVLGALEVWAMPCVPYAGKGVGFLALPEPGTGVWIEFEGGDPSYPIWTGCFWGDDEAPEKGDAKIKVLRTEKGTIRVDDGNDAILLENSSQARTEVAQSVITEAGQSRHSVGAAGVVSEQGKGKVEVTTAAVLVNNGALQVI